VTVAILIVPSHTIQTTVPFYSQVYNRVQLNLIEEAQSNPLQTHIDPGPFTECCFAIVKGRSHGGSSAFFNGNAWERHFHVISSQTLQFFSVVYMYFIPVCNTNAIAIMRFRTLNARVSIPLTQ